MTAGLSIVLLVGISEAVGQSVVLFANRVAPARFILSVLMNALLVAAGFAALVVCTWISFFIPGAHPIDIADLTIAVALSYVPLLLSFLAALPYAGNALMWGLRIAQVVAMVTGVASTAHIPLWMGAAHVAVGWGVKLGLRQVFSKPYAALETFLTNLAAGVTLVGESVAVQRVVRQLNAPAAATRSAERGPTLTTHRHGQSLFIGIIVTVLSALAIIVALLPLRGAIGHLYSGIFVLRAGFDIVWVALAAFVIAAFLAPLETLGWWAGWSGDGVDADRAAAAPHAGAPAPGAVSRYIVYLDGISQSSATYTPDVETFLDALERELPPGVVLVRGIMAYSVLNRPLDADPMYAHFWSWVERLRGRTRTAILGMFINIRNVMIVAVSADGRYGPLYNLGVAQVVYTQLCERGYPLKSGIPITLIGYSGGGQMCAETGPLLKHAFGAPLDVISLAGVMTGTCPFLRVDRFHHMYGSRDVIEPLGPIMFASRWSIMRRSSWNRARRRGHVSIVHLGPVGHQVPGGLLDPNLSMPDRRSALRHTLDHIHAILTPA